MKNERFYNSHIKRLLDIVISSLFIILFGWVFLILAIAVRIKLGSPVIFSQDRPGKDGKIFKLYKFRSMTNARDETGILLPDRRRLTKFGRLLRSTSLDELPEMYNILKGNMSLVGPRPLLVKYLPCYNSFERRRHEVRPGLTGLAQVNGRVGLTWKKKFEMDVEYVDHVSFLLDIKIVLKTIRKVFAREGIEYKQGNIVISDYFSEHGSSRAGETEGND